MTPRPQIDTDGGDAPDMLEDGGGSGARARELPPGPRGDGQVDVDQQDGPGLHLGAVPFPFPGPPGHDPQQRALHLHAAVRHERPEQAHDAGRAPPGPPRLGPHVVGERR